MRGTVSINAKCQRCPVKWAANTQCLCRGVRIGWSILSEVERLFYAQQEGHLLTLKGAKKLLFLRKHVYFCWFIIAAKPIATIFQLKENTLYLINTFIKHTCISSSFHCFELIHHYSHGHKCPDGRWFWTKNGKPGDTFTFRILWLLCWPTFSGEGIHQQDGGFLPHHPDMDSNNTHGLWLFHLFVDTKRSRRQFCTQERMHWKVLIVRLHHLMLLFFWRRTSEFVLSWDYCALIEHITVKIIIV